MIKNSRTLVLILLMPLLLGCHEEVKNYSWYMLHPQELQQEIMACQENGGLGKNASQCEIVMRAADKMTDIVNRQQEEPEKFGQSVLGAQQRLQQLNNTLINAHKMVDDLKSKNASSAELQSAQASLDKAEKDYAEQLQQVNVMLAVLGMSSPG